MFGSEYPGQATLGGAAEGPQASYEGVLLAAMFGMDSEAEFVPLVKRRMAAWRIVFDQPPRYLAPGTLIDNSPAGFYSDD